ncbi:MAG: TRZ/ATZ family hydrolase [Pseudomonadota bacterium]
MEPVDTLLFADWVVPVDETVHPDAMAGGAVAVRGGRIAAVCPADEARQRYQGKEEIKLGGHVLMPGLVNAHTHAAMTLLRGMADDLPLMRWLEDHIWPTERRWVGPGYVRAGSQLAIAEMLRSGTTCFADMYFFPDATAQVAAETGIRACIGMVAFDFPTPWASDLDEYLAKGLAMRDEYKGDALVSTMFAPHAPYTVSPDSMARIRRLSDQLDVPIQTHLHETTDELEQFTARYGCRPIEKLAELDMISPLLMGVHMTQLQAGEIDALAERGCHVVHCPESNMKLASGACPVAALVAAGVNVAIGTDGAASNNDLDMFAELRSTAFLAKHVAADPAVVPAKKVLEMATINGARALGLGDQTGSLTPGKWADIISIDWRQAATQPIHNPVSQLAYATAAAQVDHVWVAGRQLLEGGQPTRLDLNAVLASADDWAQRLRRDRQPTDAPQ